MSLKTELEAAGLNVKTVTGWGSRGGTWKLGKPVACMIHHTAPPVPYPVSALYGDLLKANINTKPDGTVWLIAQGACNYSSGAGSSVVLSEARLGQPPTENARERGLVDDMGGNAYFFNFENDHAGNGSPIPEVQHDAIVLATRVVLDHYDLGPKNVVSHAEWTTRKRDPYWNGSFRAIEAIREQLEADMPLSAEDLAKIKSLLEFHDSVFEYTNKNGDKRRMSGLAVNSAWHVDIGGKVAYEQLTAAGKALDPTALAQSILAELGPGLSAAVAAELKKLTLKAS